MALMRQIPFPPKGMPKEDVLSLLRSFKCGDSDWHEGRLFGLVYYAGQEVEEMAREAYDSCMFENALSPFDFPSLLKMETEFVSMAGALFGGDGETALYGMIGTMPDRETAKLLALQYLNDLYRLKE
jgi:glutamate/tyrosine decarboxylase-like PLP-dependent enzyme